VAPFRLFEIFGTTRLFTAGGLSEPGKFDPLGGDLLPHAQLEPVGGGVEHRALVLGAKSGEFEGLAMTLCIRLGISGNIVVVEVAGLVMDVEITKLLKAWSLGDRGVEDALIGLLYGKLRSLAQAQISRMPDQTLQATELVHEAFERLHRQHEVDWQDRSHFLAISATVIRRVLVDHLRARGREKRGGGVEALTLGETLQDGLAAPHSEIDWIELEEAMRALERTDSKAARVVELRVYGGLDVEEVAELMSSSTATVGRQWRFARAWLATRLAP
jgi:RNA polymerase sigma factor (TIGR02999 family)